MHLNTAGVLTIYFVVILYTCVKCKLPPKKSKFDFYQDELVNILILILGHFQDEILVTYCPNGTGYQLREGVCIQSVHVVLYLGEESLKLAPAN